MAARREIVLARVFFSDSSESKVRPCVVLSNDHYHSDGFLLVAAITTNLDDYCIPISEKDANCLLDKNSSVRFDGVIKLPARQAIKGIGRVSPEFYSQLVDKIVSMLK